MNAILENWHCNNIRTPSEALKFNMEHRAEFEKKKGKINKTEQTSPGNQGSFDTDDFFSAAVARSLGEDFLKKANTQGDT
jgi:DNA replication protein DnaD